MGSRKEEAVVEVTEKEVILLGLVAEEPIHAYGLEEKIRVRQLELWTTISLSSIYRVLSGLEEKGLIDTRLEHEGQGATRKVHVITDAGRLALANGVVCHLHEVVPVKNPLSVGLAYVTDAPQRHTLDALKARTDRIEAIESEITGIREQVFGQIDALELPGQPAQELQARKQRARLRVDLVLTHVMHLVRAEQEFLQTAIGMVKEAHQDLFSEVALPDFDPGRDTCSQEEEK
jgi:DNA-binding PadR family transcriptional regulator